MAVQNVAGNITINLSFTEVAALAFNTTGQFPALISDNIVFTNATGGALHCDTVHAKIYSIAATTQTINLFDGSLLSPSGAACVFARVRLFVVYVTDTTTGHLIDVATAASNGVLWLPSIATEGWVNANGGMMILFDPNSITTAGYLVDTSHKSITFDAGANTVAFNLLIVGNSSAA